MYDEIGKVDFIDREINPNTGSILIQASFPNPDGLIRPGAFGRVRIPVANAKDRLLVPQSCVGELQGKEFVYVVADGGTVERRNVTIEGFYKDYFLIKGDVTANEQVVFEGLQKVSNGVVVEAVLTQFESQYEGE